VPSYGVNLPGGQSITLNGDSPPTAAVVMDFLQQHGLPQSVPVTQAAQVGKQLPVGTRFVTRGGDVSAGENGVQPVIVAKGGRVLPYSPPAQNAALQGLISHPDLTDDQRKQIVQAYADDFTRGIELPPSAARSLIDHFVTSATAPGSIATSRPPVSANSTTLTGLTPDGQLAQPEVPAGSNLFTQAASAQATSVSPSQLTVPNNLVEDRVNEAKRLARQDSTQADTWAQKLGATVGELGGGVAYNPALAATPVGPEAEGAALLSRAGLTALGRQAAILGGAGVAQSALQDQPARIALGEQNGFDIGQALASGAQFGAGAAGVKLLGHGIAALTDRAFKPALPLQPPVAAPEAPAPIQTPPAPETPPSGPSSPVPAPAPSPIPTPAALNATAEGGLLPQGTPATIQVSPPPATAPLPQPETAIPEPNEPTKVSVLQNDLGVASQSPLITAASNVRARAAASAANNGRGFPGTLDEALAVKSLSDQANLSGRVTPPADFTASGGEHDAWFDPQSNRYFKTTRPGDYGKNASGVGIARPSDYLERLALTNSIFGDDIKVEGTLGHGDDLQIVTSQPYVDGVAASKPEIKSFMEAKGLEQVNPTTYVNRQTGIVVGDAKPKNVLATKDGSLFPIDVQVQKLAPEAVEKLYPPKPRKEGGAQTQPQVQAQQLLPVGGESPAPLRVRLQNRMAALDAQMAAHEDAFDTAKGKEFDKLAEEHTAMEKERNQVADRIEHLQTAEIAGRPQPPIAPVRPWEQALAEERAAKPAEPEEPKRGFNTPEEAAVIEQKKHAAAQEEALKNLPPIKRGEELVYLRRPYSPQWGTNAIWKPTSGKLIKLEALPKYNFVLSKDGNTWEVSEFATGRRIAGYEPTRAAVIAKAEEIIKKAGVKKFEQSVRDALKTTPSKPNLEPPTTQGGQPNATTQIRQPEIAASQFPRPETRPAIPANQEQVRAQEGRSPDGGGSPQQPAQVSAQAPSSSGPAEAALSVKPEAVLYKEPQVKLTLPKDATGISLTNEKGLRKFYTKAELEKSNILQGSPVKDVQPARMVGGKVQGVKGDVGVAPKALTSKTPGEILGFGARIKAMPPDETPIANTPEEVSTLQATYTPGLPAGTSVAQGVKSLLLPSSKSAGHLRAAEDLGGKLGAMNRRSEASASQLKPSEKLFDRLGVHNEKLPPEKNPGIQFMSDLSQGREVDPKFKAAADLVDRQFTDRLEKLEAAGAPLQTIRENYFPGMWTRESRMAFNAAMEKAKAEGIIGEDFDANLATPAQKAYIKGTVDEFLKNGTASDKDMLQYLTRSPLKGKESFRKGKVFDDIMTGAELGLRPISSNPIDLVKGKLAEMDRSIMANEFFQQQKSKGKLQTISPYEQVPDGWQKVNDKYGTIYGPPTVKVAEHVDKAVYEGLLDAAKRLGVSHQRLMKLPAKRALGLSFQGQNKILSKFGTETSVIAHELGHQLDEKYDLWNNLLKRDSGKGFAPGRSELRNIADLTGERGGNPRSQNEKIAQVLEAYVHSPEKMQEVAPRVFKWFDNFIKSKPELKGIADIKPGIELKKLEGEKYVGLPILGYRIVPNEVGDILNNYLSSSLYNNPYFGKLYKGWMATANVLNQSQLGVGSAFHAGFTTGDAQVSANANLLKDLYGVARGNRTLADLGNSAKNAATASIGTAYKGDKVLNAWRNPDGVIDPKLAQVVKAAELAGAGFKMEPGLNTEQSSKLYRDWFSGHPIKAALRSPVAATELMAKPIMDYLVPRQKAGVFADLANRIIEQNPGKPLEDLAPQFRQAWNRVDARLGQVRYNRLFMNNTAKNVMQGLVRAPGWSGGTIAEIGGAFPDAAHFFSEWARTGKAPENIPDRVAYVASLLTTVAAISGALTYAFTGQAPKGLDYLAFRTGEKDQHGNDKRFMLPTYVKDILAYTSQPGTTLLNKAHPLIGAISQLAHNKDYYGYEIHDPNASYGAQAGQIGKYVLSNFIPFWIRGAQKAQSGAGGAVASYFGVMPAPNYISQSTLQNRIEQLFGERTGEPLKPYEQQFAPKRATDPAGLYTYLFNRLPSSDKQALYKTMTPEEKSQYELPMARQEEIDAQQKRSQSVHDIYDAYAKTPDSGKQAFLQHAFQSGQIPHDPQNPAKADPQFQQAFSRLHQAAQLDGQGKQLKSLGVTDGSRAKEMLRIILQTPQADRPALQQRWESDKVLTPAVAQQIRQLAGSQ